MTTASRFTVFVLDRGDRPVTRFNASDATAAALYVGKPYVMFALKDPRKTPHRDHFVNAEKKLVVNPALLATDLF